MEVLLVASSAALAYHITRHRQHIGRGEEFRESDFQPDESLQGPKLKTFGHTKPRGPSVNTIYTDVVENYRAETPIGTVDFRRAGFRPMWTEQDAPPAQRREETVLKFDEVKNHVDVASEKRNNTTHSVLRHLSSNRNTRDGVFEDQERVAPPVRGGLSQNAPTLQPRHHRFAFGEDLTGHVVDESGAVKGQQASGGRSQLFRGEAHEIRPDRALEMAGSSSGAPRGLRPSGSIRGKNGVPLGTPLPTLEWNYGATGNRAAVLASGAHVRDEFVEPTRGMDVLAESVESGAAAGTKHRQGGHMRSAFTFGLRQLLDLPSVQTAPDRAPAVSTASVPVPTNIQQNRIQLPTVNASHKRNATTFRSTSTTPAPAMQQNRIQLPTVDASHRRNATTFRSTTTGPRAQSVAPRIPDLPPPIVNYASHPVGQTTSTPAPRSAVTQLEAEVDLSTAAPERAGVRPFEFRDNRNIAATTAVLADELPTGLRMPFTVPSQIPISRITPSEGTQREPGEFLRR